MLACAGACSYGCRCITPAHQSAAAHSQQILVSRATCEHAHRYRLKSRRNHRRIRAGGDKLTDSAGKRVGGVPG